MAPSSLHPALGANLYTEAKSVSKLRTHIFNYQANHRIGSVPSLSSSTQGA